MQLDKREKNKNIIKHKNSEDVVKQAMVVKMALGHIPSLQI